MNYGYKKFLIIFLFIKGKTSLIINQDKIAAENRWDGLHGVITNVSGTPHYWSDTGLGDYGLYFLRDKEKREVDFLVAKDDVPWFIVEVKSTMEQPLSSSLKVFAKQLKAQHVFQVGIDGVFIDKNIFDIKRPIIVPAKTFLSQLV